ncbi:SDR family NAD(P)-dependent oxidoreductase [Arsenicicoccus sp. oral taxon 190]|uniref:SDR family NAD(P)-dependent oxidoreductase n=1 Tax=Arsenicicoccus sp. oral taxon 190 TaxID=1658671 RepID=UPI000679F1E2|nr:SDR family oxidoreductase [Arsenicicoccus sp. oral taxon 190]AKT50369.1 short-chain dehydrogenase [Arsenicicoccus sp. oral taxon 190]
MATALVTGASSGIGLAFARELARRGHDLVLVARTEERLRALAADLGDRHGTRCEVLVADLVDRDDLHRVADRVSDPQAPVDLVVNNAGYGLRTDFLRTPVEQEEHHLLLHTRAVLVLSQAAALAMRARGCGAIVNVSSVASFVSMGTYSAAKAWCTTFTEGLAAELAGTGVTATALCPGFTHTEFHERAAMNMSHLPEAAWLDADRLVRDCLDDVARGAVVSVPGPLYKGLVGVVQLAPRGLVRRVSAQLAHGRRTRR